MLHTSNTLGVLLSELERLQRDSNLHTSEDPRFSNASNVQDHLSIHFNIDNADRLRRIEYSTLVNADLEMQQLPISGRLWERQERLRKQLEAEYMYRKLKDALDHGRKSEAHAIVKLHETVPCILHMENRVGLKLLTMLLLEGLDNALKRKTYTELPAEGQRMKRFFSDIEDVCNKQIWGTEENPTQWQCPRDEAKKELGTICLDNNKTRRLINAIDHLYGFCLEHSDEQDSRYFLWKRCIPFYRQAMIIVRSKEDLSQEQTIKFQQCIDLFFQDWVYLHGREGVMNYIHMLGSGHITEFIVYWGNLYSHSQQGWEAFNSLVKTYYFRRTARGGSGNRGVSTKSRVIPIARWLSRRMMWMCNIPFTEIKQMVELSNTHTQEDEEESAIGPVIDVNH